MQPQGYDNTFKDLNAAVSANTYLGLHTLQTYDTKQCAKLCDDTELCTGFNVYIERDPAWNPEQCSCDEPDPFTNFKCTLWGSGVTPESATNKGQNRGKFQVVIIGSNGYEKTKTVQPPSPPNWTKPQRCGAVHDHPRTCIGNKVFKGPFDVSLCASYADAQNKRNQASGWFGALLNMLGYNRAKVSFFNAFMLKKNGRPVGTYCKLFAQQYEPNTATYKPGNINGAQWGFETSWSYCKN